MKPSGSIFKPDLKVGDTFETEGVFPGVSYEPLKWKAVNKRGGRLTVEATYYGIHFGAFEVTLRKNKEPKVVAL